MKYKEITYNKKNLVRISAAKVKNIINKPSKFNGLIIYVLPINANPASPWINGFDELEINIKYMDTIDYINFINEYKYYNCIEELGNYLKFYIEK